MRACCVSAALAAAASRLEAACDSAAAASEAASRRSRASIVASAASSRCCAERPGVWGAPGVAAPSRDGVGGAEVRVGSGPASPERCFPDVPGVGGAAAAAPPRSAFLVGVSALTRPEKLLRRERETADTRRAFRPSVRSLNVDSRRARPGVEACPVPASPIAANVSAPGTNPAAPAAAVSEPPGLPGPKMCAPS